MIDLHSIYGKDSDRIKTYFLLTNDLAYRHVHALETGDLETARVLKPILVEMLPTRIRVVWEIITTYDLRPISPQTVGEVNGVKPFYAKHDLDLLAALGLIRLTLDGNYALRAGWEYDFGSNS